MITSIQTGKFTLGTPPLIQLIAHKSRLFVLSIAPCIGCMTGVHQHTVILDERTCKSNALQCRTCSSVSSRHPPVAPLISLIAHSSLLLRLSIHWLRTTAACCASHFTDRSQQPRVVRAEAFPSNDATGTGGGRRRMTSPCSVVSRRCGRLPARGHPW